MNAALPVQPVLHITAGRALRLTPPVAALAYPLFLRLGALGLLPALAMPLLALFAASQPGLDGRFPRARRIAHVAFAAPPLFTLLGGLFDFQSRLPLSSVGLWIPFWLLATAAVWIETPHDQPSAFLASGRLGIAHGFSALGITLFGLAHVVNHVAGFWSGELHIRIMNALRIVYRNPVVEIVLFALIGFQILSGSVLLARKLRWPGNVFDTLQTTTAGYLTAFFLSHSLAVLSARFLQHENTNWNWLTRHPFLTDAWAIRLLPYYFLTVVVFGVHGACGVRKVLLAHGYPERTASGIVQATALVSILASVLILCGLWSA